MPLPHPVRGQPRPGGQWDLGLGVGAWLGCMPWQPWQCVCGTGWGSETGCETGSWWAAGGVAPPKDPPHAMHMHAMKVVEGMGGQPHPKQLPTQGHV